MDSSIGSNYASCYMNSEADGSPWKQRNSLSRSFGGTKPTSQGMYTDSPGFGNVQQNYIAAPVVRYNENIYSWFYGILATRQFSANRVLFICAFAVLFILSLSARFTLWTPLDSIVGEFLLLFSWKFWMSLLVGSGLFGFGFGYFSFNYLFSPYNETQPHITKLSFWRCLATFFGVFLFGVLTLPFVIGIMPSWTSNFTTSLLLFTSLLVTCFKISLNNVFRYTFNSKMKNQLGWKAVLKSCLSHLRNNAWDTLKRTTVTLQYSYIASFLIALFFGFLRKNMLSLFDPMLFFHTAVVICASYLLADLTCISANAVMSEGIDFPMPTAFFFSDARETVVNLVNAMNSSDLLLRQFAFHDFRIKSQNDQKGAFFTLSQPGNHPRLWSAITNQCMFIVDYISGVYLKKAEIALANSRIPGFQMPQGLSGDRSMKSSMLLPPALKPKQLSDSKNIPLVNLEPVKVVVKPYFEKVYNFIFTPQHIVSTAESELALNAIEGLANLVEASYKLDKYGMAQKSLPVIVGSFLKLAVACDQLIRAKSMRRVNASPVESRIFETREAVVAALNDIYTAFQSHINDLHLPSDQLTLLKEYVETI